MLLAAIQTSPNGYLTFHARIKIILKNMNPNSRLNTYHFSNLAALSI